MNPVGRDEVIRFLRSRRATTAHIAADYLMDHDDKADKAAAMLNTYITTFAATVHNKVAGLCFNTCQKDYILTIATYSLNNWSRQRRRVPRLVLSLQRMLACHHRRG